MRTRPQQRLAAAVGAGSIQRRVIVRVNQPPASPWPLERVLPRADTVLVTGRHTPDGPTAETHRYLRWSHRGSTSRYRRGLGRRPTGPHPKEPQTSNATGEPLAIPSIPNLRDVGGCPTRSGGRVRTGLFYRSSGLHALAEADIDALARLAIRTVYDLRMAREQAEAPDRLPAGTRHLPVDVLAGWTDGGPSQLFAWFEDAAAARVGLGGGGAEALWVEQYRAFVRLPSAQAGYGTLFRDLAVEAHRPALVHCATGKDRTGWAAAALQLLLDVPEDAVMGHFLESRRYLGPLVESLLAAVTERGGDPELFRPILDVRPSYLDAALDEVRRRYGTIDRYFSDGLSVDEATQEALRTSFTR